MCVCVGASPELGRAAARLAKLLGRGWPGEPRPLRAAPSGAALFRLRRGRGKALAPSGQPRCPGTRSAAPSPLRPRPLAPLRRGARMREPRRPASPARGASHRDTECPQGRGGPGSVRTRRQSPGCRPPGGHGARSSRVVRGRRCPRAGRCRARRASEAGDTPHGRGAPDARGSPSSPAAEGFGHPAGPLLGSGLRPVAFNESDAPLALLSSPCNLVRAGLRIHLHTSFSPAELVSV